MSQNGKLTFIDLETGGLDPRRHPIIQVAAIAVDGETLRAVDSIEIKVQFDERKAAKFALRKNSFSRKVWKDEGLPEHDAAELLAGFLRKHATVTALARNGSEYKLAQLVAHNASFDGEFLQAWFERLRVYLPARRQMLCTLQRSLWHFFENPAESPPVDFKLATLCKHFGVPLLNAHDAMGDIEATVGLYRAIVAAPHRATGTLFAA